MKFRDINKKRRLGSPEKITGESKTVPNMALNVKDIINKKRQGLMPDIQKQGQFEMDTFGEDINPLRKKDIDLTDLDDIKQDIQSANREVSKVKDKLKKEAEIKEKEQLKKDIKEEIKKEDGKSDLDGSKEDL